MTTHLIFVSHASADSEIAMSVCRAIERDELGMRAWVAPRDLPAGAPYASSIMDGIERSALMVVVLSEHANASEHVAREVELAARQHKPLLPMRITAIEPAKELVYFLGRTHWFDALSRPIENHLGALVWVIRNLLLDSPGSRRLPDRTPTKRTQTKAPPGSTPLIQPVPAPAKPPTLKMSGQLRQEIATIKGLCEPGETELDLFLEGVTDLGLAWLAKPGSKYKGLEELRLHGAGVSDRGIAALAHPDTALTQLRSLKLGSTRVSDAGLAYLARPDTPLRALSTLNLYSTPIGNAGVVALARPDCGLKELTDLDLDGTRVSNAGAAALARRDCGLENLASLSLNDTRVTADKIEAIQARFPGCDITF